MVKGWCRKLGLRGNYASHTLRKTFGYIHRQRDGADLKVMVDAFGHKSERQTLHYLCIQRDEVAAIYGQEI
jgi:site-specific recombinase XerD